MAPAARFEVVVAENVARLRKERGWTQKQLAWELEIYGLPWTRATIAQVETGRRVVGFAEAIAVAAALDVGLEDLVATAAEHVQIHEGTWTAEWLRDAVAHSIDGNAPEGFTSPAKVRVWQASRDFVSQSLAHQEETWRRVRQRWAIDPDMTHGVRRDLEHRARRLPERQMAERLDRKTGLGVTPLEVVVAANATWSHSIERERDRRVAKRNPDAKAASVRAARGHVTRELEEELERAIEKAADQSTGNR